MVDELQDGLTDGDSDASEALESGEFAALFESHPTAAAEPPEGYSTHPSLPVAYKVRTG